MLSWYRFDYRIITTVLLGLAVGALLNILLPVFARNPLFLLVLPAAGAFFLFLLVRPKETLILLLLARPLLDTVLELTKISVGATQFGAGAALNMAVIVLAVFMAFYYKGFPQRDPMVRWWTIYICVFVLSTSYSDFKGQAVRLVINQITYFAMFLLPFFLVKKREDFLFWLKILLISFIAPTFWGNLDWAVFGGRYFPDSGQRITGSFSHPNVLAFYLTLGITVYFYMFIGEFYQWSRFKKACLIGVLLNMIALLLATKTRNAWIACFGIFFIYGLLKDRKTLAKLLLVACLALAFIPAVQQRVLSVIEPPKVGDYEGMNSFEWRVEMWKSSIPRILRKPFLGHGLASFKPMSAEFSTVGANGAHNVYIELLFDSGLLGLLSFIPLFFAPLIMFIKQMRTSKTVKHSQLCALLAAYVISYMLICTSDNMLYYLAFNWYVWFFLGLILAAAKIKVAES